MDSKWLLPLDDEAVYNSWFAINYNFAVSQRMVKDLESELYRIAVTVRMAVYGHSDTWFGYFTLRKIPWCGDKAAVNYLLHHDPSFLEEYQQFIFAQLLNKNLTSTEKLRLLLLLLLVVYGKEMIL